jgi:uncharacterized protein (TIGR02266 family)
MAPLNAGGSDRRRWPRVTLAARVALSSPTLDDLVAGPLQDLSVGGLFIVSRTTKPIGTELTVAVAVADANVRIECRGLVVREVTAAEAAETGRSPGMGILFTELDPKTRATIERLIEAAVQRKVGAL